MSKQQKQSKKQQTAKQKTDDICALLMEHQRKRSSLIKMRISNVNQIVAYLSRFLGYSSFDKEDDRKKKWRLAEKIWKAMQLEFECEQLNQQNKKTKKKKIEFPKECDYEKISLLCSPTAFAIWTTVNQLNHLREQEEEIMKDLVSQLPICSWWLSHRGLAEQLLASLIGEAGNLDDYENPAKLWKRFGVAVLDGKAQGKLPKGTAAETWVEHGYSKRRRSVLWLVGDCLIKNNQTGKYRTLYLERKALEKKRYETFIEEQKKKGVKIKNKPVIPHRRAQRYMEKTLLKDLFNQWHNKKEPAWEGTK